MPYRPQPEKRIPDGPQTTFEKICAKVSNEFENLPEVVGDWVGIIVVACTIAAPVCIIVGSINAEMRRICEIIADESGIIGDVSHEDCQLLKRAYDTHKECQAKKEQRSRLKLVSLVHDPECD